MNNYLMENREVTKTIKNQYGEVVALCNDAELWSPKLRSIAIPEIELSINRYFVRSDGEEIEVQVKNGEGLKKTLATDSAGSDRDLLKNLPDCD